jgi:putative phosphoesterase
VNLGVLKRAEEVMILGILSDTHDRLARTINAVSLLAAAGAEALIHCGDLTGSSIVEECGRLPSYYVFGNNDFDESGLQNTMEAFGGVCLGRGGEVTLGGRRIAVTHGDSIREVNRLARDQPDYLLFGHSHQAHDERRGTTRWINPGALHRAAKWSVAVLDLDTDVLTFLDVNV